MSETLRAVAVLGGTFDPVHIGHLRSAVELRERFDFEQVRLVPSRQPPHRGQPAAAAEHRLRMVELALTGEPGLRADGRELRRTGPSYTVDTLTELRAELGADCSLSLVLGVDAFAGLASWHAWEELPRLAHLLVIARPDSVLPDAGPVAELLRARRAGPEALHRRPAGAVVAAALTPLPVSATAVRSLIAAGRSPRYLVPDAVWSYIRAQHLYDVPSSQTRDPHHP